MIRNADGLLGRGGRWTATISVPRFLCSPVTGPEDWKRFEAERLDEAHGGRRVDLGGPAGAASRRPRLSAGVHCGSMIGKVRALLTFPRARPYAIHDYPEMVEDMVEAACRLTLAFLDQVLPAMGFDFASGWEDISSARTARS